MGLADIPIDQISAWRVRMALREGFVSAQTSITERQVVLVRITLAGHPGWGEAAPVRGHSDEDIESLWQTLLKLTGTHGLGATHRSTGMVRAAFNQAADDAAARQAGLPLWEALGGTGAVEASAAIGADADGQPSRTQLESAVDAGYRNMKLKVTPVVEPGRVADLVREHPDVAFGADANGSLGDNETGLLADLDNIGLEYIEQPGAPRDLELHARLCEELDTPISLDESADSPTAIEKIVEMGAADIVNLKAGRFGTTKTLEIAATTVAGGIKVRLGGLIETGIGRAHTVALAAHPIFTVAGDIAGSDRYFVNDLVIPQWRIADGRLTLPSGSGIGVQVDEEAVAGQAIDHITVG